MNTPSPLSPTPDRSSRVSAGEPGRSRPRLPRSQWPEGCDLILKGGISSGIVYPLAVVEFARHFQLRSIGGASAGAIAAAAAAAAQLGKNQGHDRFDQLARLPEQLAEADAAGNTRLLRLFQPAPALRRVYACLLAGLSPSRRQPWLAALRWLIGAALQFPISAFVGALLTALAVWLGSMLSNAPLAWGSATPAALAAEMGLSAGVLLLVRALWLRSASGATQMVLNALIAALLAGAIIAAAFHVAASGEPVNRWNGFDTAAATLAIALGTLLGALLGLLGCLLRELPRHRFGLCDGMGQGDTSALTPWLHQLIQSLAGRGVNDKPVTFGDLWASGVDLADPSSAHQRTALRGIDLRMMTSALSHGRPYSFPLDPGERFYFDLDEMRQLLPSSVVDWMQRHPGQPSREQEAMQQRIALPEMVDLPILLATRMSLSFPLLLQAVPLYRYDHSRDVEQRVWFSDGGICSNFPVHYFDAPLPTRPTFAINLVDAQYLPPDPREPQDFIRVPKTNGAGQEERHVPIHHDGGGGILSFFQALLETMHNWSDNSQLRMPGFRDRVAQVRLRSNEGGLNLRMSRDLVLQLARRGQHAAQVLVDQFFPQRDYDHDTTWQNHRWVRFRTSMPLLEEALISLAVADDSSRGSDVDFEALHASPPSYHYSSDAQARRSYEVYREILTLARLIADRQGEDEPSEEGKNHSVFAPHNSQGPKPRAQLRIRPRM